MYIAKQNIAQIYRKWTLLHKRIIVIVVIVIIFYSKIYWGSEGNLCQQPKIIILVIVNQVKHSYNWIHVNLYLLCSWQN